MASSGGLKTFERFSTSLPQAANAVDPITHTQSPVTTGTSVLAMHYDKGVIMAADMLGSYGALARFRNINRLLKVNDQVVIGCTGDYADYQYLQAIIEQMEVDEASHDDGFGTTARSLHSWLTRVLYNKRCKFDPFWTTFLVAGVDITDKGERKQYLGFVDKIGTAYTDTVIATGYGSMLATPMMRKLVEDKARISVPGTAAITIHEAMTKLSEPANIAKISELEARECIEECMKVMYYRDARAFNKYQIAYVPVTGEPARIEGPFEVKGEWGVAHFIHGYE